MNRKEELIKHTSKQLIEQGNMSVIIEIFSPNYIAHAGDKKYTGHQFVKRFTQQVRTAIPDIKVKKIEFFTQTGNIITWQRTFNGTHIAGMQGIPASMKKIKWHDIVVTRFEDDKIAEEWVASDLASQLMFKLYKN